MSIFRSFLIYVKKNVQSMAQYRYYYAVFMHLFKPLVYIFIY